MLAFWRNGYESTSVKELTRAMGLTPPSIYNVFGDKKQLFLEAVERYCSHAMPAEALIHAAPSGRRAAETLLQAAAHLFTAPESPPGCLLAHAAITSSESAADVSSHLAEIRRGIRKLLENRIEQDRQQGLLPRSADPGTLASHVMAVLNGLSTLARDGHDRDSLLRLGTLTLACWPADPRLAGATPPDEEELDDGC